VDRGLSIANRERFIGLPQVAGATEGGNHLTIQQFNHSTP
jgi:hypothetical protein